MSHHIDIESIRAARAESIRESGYVGWVAWIGADPIFEANAPHAYQPVPGGIVLPHRREARATREWDDLPHRRLHRVEVYFGHAELPNHAQPVLRIDRPEGLEATFFQFKKRGTVLGFTPGYADSGIFGYCLGIWIPGAPEAAMIEVNRRDGVLKHPPVRHPCWPKRPRHLAFDPLRHGYGLNPALFGLGYPSPAPTALTV